jgi:hypothetical protein
MFHQEADGITASAATKTFVDFLNRRYRERGCFFVVKRAEAKVIGASFFQFDEASNDLGDVNAT